MSEAGFPLVATMLVVVVVTPLCAVLARLALVVVESAAVGGPLGALWLRYVLLTSSSALPFAWFLSAGLHESEPRNALAGCLADHDVATSCIEPVLFVVVLVVVVALLVARVLPRRARSAASTSPRARALAQRIDGLVAAAPRLADLRGRIVVTDDADVAIGTEGLLAPRVVVGVDFGADLSDEMLVAALGHERVHVRAFDPLRYLLLEVALALNPVGGRMLRPHAARWRAAREIACDRTAVVAGAAPLALADAIVRAARPQRGLVVALGTPETATLRLRVDLLLAFVEQRPLRRRAEDGVALSSFVLVLLAATLWMPHRDGATALATVHEGVEQVMHWLVLEQGDRPSHDAHPLHS